MVRDGPARWGGLLDAVFPSHRDEAGRPSRTARLLR